MAVAAVSAGALTLGAGRGSVVLGSPLDISFSVQVDGGGTDLQDSCVSAHVDMGGTPVPENRVRVSLVTQGAAQPRVRVRTSVPVNEPVVAVRLDAACSGRVSRTYTFLSELPGEAKAPVSVVAASVDRQPVVAGDKGEGRAAVQAPDEARVQGSGRRTGGDGLRRHQGSLARSQAKAAVAGRRQAESEPVKEVPPPVVAADAVRPGAAPRLVMEPLEVWLETPPELRLSMDPPRFAEAGSTQARQEAAEVWRGLNTPPEELAQADRRADGARLQAQALKERLQAEQSAGLEAQQQLRRVQSERFSPWVVYGLAGCLALALLGLAWQAHRARRQPWGAWYRGVALDGEELGADALSEAVGATVWPRTEVPDPPVTAPAVQSLPVGGSAPLPRLDAGAGEVVPEPPSSSVAESAAPAALRLQDIEHPEDLFDVLQQAEFFISIGEHEQAVEGLRRHIALHAASSPLAYLELLRLYHTLGRAAAFEQLRAGFEDRFNAEVPSFATFQRGGRSLEDYGAELERIESLWGSSEVIDELDRLMFRREGAQAVARFDLPAYEDLLLLAAIAQSSSGRGCGASPAAATAPAAAGAGKLERPSVDTLAGDLMLEPSQHMPARVGPPVGKGMAGSALPPEILAPEEIAPHEDEVRFSLAPKDSGRRVVK